MKELYWKDETCAQPAAWQSTARIGQSAGLYLLQYGDGSESYCVLARGLDKVYVLS
jgi:hypothetical protein